MQSMTAWSDMYQTHERFFGTWCETVTRRSCGAVRKEMKSRARQALNADNTHLPELRPVTPPAPAATATAAAAARAHTHNRIHADTQLMPAPRHLALQPPHHAVLPSGSRRWVERRGR